jgi:MFS family permease
MRERFAASSRDTFRSFRVRNFRVFFAGQVISQAGNWLTRIGQTLLVLHLTDDGLAVGIVTACEFLPMLLFGAWTGLVADRSDKRRLLIIVQSVAMVQSFVMAALAFLDHPPLHGIYAVALFGGCVSAFDFPARKAFVVELVALEDVNNAISLNTAVMNLARVVGPALAGLLVTTVGYGWCFTLDAFTYVAVLVGLFLIDPAKLRAAPITLKAKGQIRAGLRYARSLPNIWIPLVIAAIVGVLAYNFQVVLPLVVTHSYGDSVGTFTILYSVLSIGSLFGALAAARRHSVRILTVVVTCAMFGVSMLIIAAAPSLGWSLPIVLIVGAASTYFMTAATALIQINSSPQMQGRVSSLQTIVLVGSTPIGSPLLGFICDRYGARGGLLVGGLAALAAAAVGQFANRPKRTSVTTTPERLAIEPGQAPAGEHVFKRRAG